MYAQPAFQETRQEVLLAAIRDIQLGAFVSPAVEGLEITHAPVAVREHGNQIFLETHLARANSHWKAIGEGMRSAAIFQGPQAYVSPSWYPSKAAHGKVVPTWVYIAVHAHGVLEAVHDAEWLRAHLDALTATREASRAAPWEVSDAPERFIAGLSRGIVGLRLTVDRLEGSWKINQNKPDADREGTAEGLRTSGAEGAALADALAKRMS
ncbi:MAG: FMN-binding negative transcriptional regulator [Pseudomonadota bacterium]